MLSKHNALNSEEEQAVEKRLHAISKMFEHEQFQDVQKQCAGNRRFARRYEPK